MAAMPGKVKVACKIDKMAIKNSKLKVKEIAEKHTKHAVIQNHEAGHGHKTPQGRVEAFFDVFSTEG
jgi:hypothetical protein